MLTAAGSIGLASGDLLRHIGEGETDERFQVRVLLVVVFSVYSYKLGCTVPESDGRTCFLDTVLISLHLVYPTLQDIMMNLAKAVANSAALLVLKAKNVAQVAEDTALQNRVITAATQCALSTSQLVACTKVM